jgi:hypothetical protein
MNNKNLQYLTDNLPSYSIDDKSIGVVTGSDTNTFEGLQVLFYSLKGKISFLCYDLGLTDKELDWCRKENISIKQCPTIFTKNKPKHWQTYTKPWLVQDSPFEYTIWFDTDCIVVGDLTKADLINNKQTFFTKHWIHPDIVVKNGKPIYKTFPVAEKSTYYINAGVFGINKHTHGSILRDWIKILSGCLQDEGLIKHLASGDEGGLHWSLQNNGDLSLIVDDYRYNMCSAVHRSHINKHTIQPFFVSGISFNSIKFFETCCKQKEAFVLHFSTCLEHKQKYWKTWPCEVF